MKDLINERKRIGMRLRCLRLDLSLSVRHMHEITTLDRNTITKIEKGESVALDSVLLYARGLEVYIELIERPKL